MYLPVEIANRLINKRKHKCFLLFCLVTMIPVISSVWARRGRSFNLFRFAVDSVLTVTCDDIITLNALLIDDPVDRTFEWEQISGDPVIWLESRFQPNVMFQQSVIRNDKVFRFWVDKGRSSQAFKDILVTAVPTDNFSTSYRNISISVPASSLPTTDGLFALRELVPQMRPAGSIYLNDASRSVMYTVPTNTLLVRAKKRFTVFLREKVGADYVNVQSTVISEGNSNASVSYVNNIQVDKTYFLQGTGENDSLLAGPFSMSSLTFGSMNDLAISDETVYTPSVYSVDSAYSILETISRTIEYYDIEEDIFNSNLPGINESAYSILETISRTLQYLDVDDTDDQITMSIQPTISNFNILEVIAYQYSSIG